MNDKLISQTKLFKIYQKEIKTKKGTYLFEYGSLFNDTKDTVMVAGITSKKELLFLRSRIFPTDEDGLYLPGGKVDKNESLEAAAIREFAEETGFKPQDIKKITEVGILPKYLIGKTHFFIAWNLIKAKNFYGDEVEELELVKIPIKKLKELILKGEINDSRSVALSLLVLLSS